MTATLYSPHGNSLLDSLQFQGQRNDCGPFATATVVNALRGLRVDPELLAREMDKPIWRGSRFVIRRVPRWATFPWGIVDALKTFGLDATWRPFATRAYLKRELIRGKLLMPVIGSIIPLWAHVMSLVAWDELQGWGFANTQFDHHNIYWLADQEFGKRWNAMLNLLVEVHNA
jgi:hypothetical protein